MTNHVAGAKRSKEQTGEIVLTQSLRTRLRKFKNSRIAIEYAEQLERKIQVLDDLILEMNERHDS